MKKTIILIGLMGLVLVLSGCPNGGNDGNGGTEEMTIEQAREIAFNSSCMDEGNLTGIGAYNEDTKSWWFDTDIEKPNCTPACVVSEETETAEINWMCLGALIQDGKSFETAILIETESSEEGISMEYDWLEENACMENEGPLEVEMQELQENNGSWFDVMSVRCNSGETEIYYFNIDNFFGNW